VFSPIKAELESAPPVEHGGCTASRPHAARQPGTRHIQMKHPIFSRKIKL
jgi:hypothetical protein